MELKIGQKLEISHKEKLVCVEVISPHHFGYNKPLVGFNLNQQKDYTGISPTTLSQWLKGSKKGQSELFVNDISLPKVEHLQLPKSKHIYPVHFLPIYRDKTNCNEPYRLDKVVEISDFINLCFMIISYEKINHLNKYKIKGFLQWLISSNIENLAS